MRNAIKQLLIKMHLLGAAKGLRSNYRLCQRIWRGNVRLNDNSITKRYFSQYQSKKLHIGCGINIIEGWLNSDFCPSLPNVIHIDATKKFPLKSNIFNYIFSEHMIEHISYSGGFNMLSECYRTLKNNGKIRISTPDLQFLIDLYKKDKSKLQDEYIKWSTNNCIKSAPYADATFIINNFVRDWGHLFIYDEKTLRSSLERAGFTNIVKCELNCSENKELLNLENETRMPKGFLKLETFTLEATKLIDSL